MASRKKAADQAVVDAPVQKTDDALFSTPTDAVPENSRSSSHLKLPTFWPDADEIADLTRAIHEPDALVEIYLRNHARSTPTVITRSERTVALSNYKLDGGVCCILALLAEPPSCPRNTD